MIIDAHTHIYPDKISAKAVKSIGDFYSLEMRMDGTVDSLVRLADEAGVDKCLVCSAAVDGEHVRHVNDFILSAVRAYPDRLIGLGTLHPDMADPEKELRYILGNGLKGVKLHPDMQKFALDETRADKLYSVCEGVCPMLLHTGDKRFAYSNPSRVANVLKRHPRMRFICAHLGGYTEWEEAANCLMDTDVMVDCSSSFLTLGIEESHRLMMAYGEDRVIFGSDYPMWNMKSELQIVRGMGLSDRFMEKLLSGNILRVLGEDKV